MTTNNTTPHADSPPCCQLDYMKYAKRAASPKIFYYALYYLTAVLVVGTITQVELGIYGAQERYFSAWIIWCMDAVPVPGGRLTLALMSLNLMCKLLFLSRWKIKSAGVNITHIGMFLLMCGALLTAYFSVEGSMSIKEGHSASYYVDGEQKTFKIVDISEDGADHALSYFGPYLQSGTQLQHQRFTGTITVLNFYRNAEIEMCDEQVGTDWRGFARRHLVTEKRLDKESHKNIAVAVVELAGFDESENGRYIVAQFNDHPDIVSSGGKEFRLEVGPRVYRLPNGVRFELIDFKAEYHPGTGTPSAYSSRLRIFEDGAKREALISMNEPLRMHNHTFYQSSFQQMNGEETTVLSVVKNYGRMFPYISSIVMCIGLALHLLLHYSAFASHFVKGRSTND